MPDWPVFSLPIAESSGGARTTREALNAETNRIIEQLRALIVAGGADEATFAAVLAALSGQVGWTRHYGDQTGETILPLTTAQAETPQDAIQVFVGGLWQEPGVAWSKTGETLVFAAALPPGPVSAYGVPPSAPIFDEIAAMRDEAQGYILSPMPLLPLPGAVIATLQNGAALFARGFTAGEEELSMFPAAHSFSVDKAYISVSTGAVGSARVFIYATDAQGRPTGNPTRSELISTNDAGTIDADIDFTFVRGRVYAVGLRCSAAPTIRVGNTGSAVALSWTTGATPSRRAVLQRTVAIGSTAVYPAFSNDRLATLSAPWIGLRIAP